MSRGRSSEHFVDGGHAFEFDPPHRLMLSNRQFFPRPPTVISKDHWHAARPRRDRLENANTPQAQHFLLGSALTTLHRSACDAIGEAVCG